MITKEQALSCKQFKQIACWDSRGINCTMPLDKPVNWRANGKCKTWKRSPEKFKLPIKHGLYDYAYITNENCHLFEVAP